jgi:hypothetical protein
MNTIMDIYSKPGTKIIFSNPENGLDSHIIKAKEKLSLGEIYTVKRIHVYRDISFVALEEIEDETFNTCLFSPA